MQNNKHTAPRKKSARESILPASYIVGRHASAILFKRRLEKTNLPYNLMFLLFDDGTGMEFAFPGLLLPEAQMDAASCEQEIRNRRKSHEARIALRARLPLEDRSDRPNIRPFHRYANTTVDSDGRQKTHDKKLAKDILGKRIEALYFSFEIGKLKPMGYLDLVLADGTAFEFITSGTAPECYPLKSFNISEIINSYEENYENEVLAVQDPDSEEIALLINRLHQWSDI